MSKMITLAYAVISVIAGILLGTWLFMLRFGPFGFLFFISEQLESSTLARLDALPGPPLAFAMLVVALLLARLVWRRASIWRWLIVTTALLLGIPSIMWIVFVMAMGPAVPNFGAGG